MDDSTHATRLQKTYYWKWCLEVRHVGSNRDTNEKVHRLSLSFFIFIFYVWMCIKFEDSVYIKHDTFGFWRFQKCWLLECERSNPRLLRALNNSLGKRYISAVCSWCFTISWSLICNYAAQDGLIVLKNSFILMSFRFTWIFL